MLVAWPAPRRGSWQTHSGILGCDRRFPLSSFKRLGRDHQALQGSMWRTGREHGEKSPVGCAAPHEIAGYHRSTTTGQVGRTRCP